MSDECTCEKCQRPVRVGDHPFCPHEPTKLVVIGDEWVGGRVMENGFDTPTRFDSRSAHEAALAANGFEVRAKWAGPNDTVMTNWAAGIDATTLANAAALVSRTKTPKGDVPIDVTTLAERFTVEAEA